MANIDTKHDGLDSLRPDVDARTIEFIESIASQVQETIARGELPTLDILVRSLSNVSYDPEQGFLELGETRKSPTLSVNTIRSFAKLSQADGNIPRHGAEQRFRHQTRSILRQQELGGLSLR